MEQQTLAVRTVYEFPVAAHLCSDGVVRYTKLIRRNGSEQPQGICENCHTAFQYRKPKPSQVKHFEGEGTSNS